MTQTPYLLPLRDLPAEGTTLTFEETALWEPFIREFSMDCRLEKPLHATLTVVPSAEGVALRGRLEGTVILPCNRCAEDTEQRLDWSFEDFDLLPSDQTDDRGAGKAFSPDEETRIVLDHGQAFLDMQAVLWEEFVLALPQTPLCREDCRGLCPVCGCNRNTETCSCSREEGDPRLAVFRDMKIRPKEKT